MKARMERLMKHYHSIRKELGILEFQLNHFKGISDDEVIASMTFSHPQGEKVQSSDLSDKTAKAAIHYQAVADRLNDAYFDSLLKQHENLKEEMEFFEYCICQLEGELSNIITDMVINCLSWMELADKYHVSQTMISKYRKKAVAELAAMYEIREQQIETYILS